MDIPRPQSPLTSSSLENKGARQSSSAESASKSFAAISAVDSLQLQEGKHYQAKVLGTATDVLPQLIAQHASAKSADLDTLVALEKAIAALSKDQAKQEWILQLQGKYIRIQSQSPLLTGQTLDVTFDGIGLIVQNAGRSLINQSSTQIPPVLLEAINKVISQQLSMDTGTKLLAELSTKAQQVPLPHIANQQAQLALTSLLKALPQKHHFIGDIQTATTNPTQSNAAAAHTTLGKRLLSQSGLFFENQLSGQASKTSTSTATSGNKLKAQHALMTLLMNTLTQNPLKTNQAEQAQAKSNSSMTPLAQISQLLGQIYSAQGTTAPTNSANATPSTSNDAASAQRVATNTLLSLLNTPDAKQVLNELKLTPSQFIQALLPSMTTQGTQQASPAGVQPAITSLTPDLKGLLLSLVQGLATSAGAASQDKAHTMAEPHLLQQPFNFPPLLTAADSTSMAKANSFLAEQEWTTGQLLKLMASMLNRLQFNQLNSLYQTQTNSNENVNTQSWFFEIPIAADQKQIDTFNLRIDKQDEQAKDQEEAKKAVQWSISLAFNLDELGSIYIQANLIPPGISTIIWADKAETHQLIQKEQHHFRQRLLDLGLEVGDITCQQGLPKQNKAKIDRNLVDVQA